MAAFGNDPDEWNRLDYRILQNSPIALYHRPDVLAEDTSWFRAEQYRVYEFDCSTWTSSDALHEDLRRTFDFPDWYGRNLDAFNDSLSDLAVPNVGGAALVFSKYDLFAAALPNIAWHTLDIIATNSRRFLLFGRRFVALVQSDDPDVHFEQVGAQPVIWSPKEWLERLRRARERRGIWVPPSS
jgi:hypothetical protein